MASLPLGKPLSTTQLQACGLTALKAPALPRSGRHVHLVTDAELQALDAKADAELRDAIDGALLTGRRPADALKMTREDIHDGALFVAQNKTGAKRAVEVVGELA
jgi:integrase